MIRVQWFWSNVLLKYFDIWRKSVTPIPRQDKTRHENIFPGKGEARRGQTKRQSNKNVHPGFEEYCNSVSAKICQVSVDNSHLSFKKHISVLKTQCKEALNLIRVVAHLKWGGDRDTLLKLYRAIVRSKFDYGCIVYGTASNTNLRQLDSIHNSGLRLALGAFCASPVSSLYTEANEAPLEERRLKLSMHYYVKTSACIDNPAHHALHEFDRTTRDLYAPRPNGRGGMTRPPAPPIAELVCPLRTPNFPPGTHDYDPKRHDLIEGVSKWMISGQEAQAKFNEYREAQGSHDEVYTDGSKINEKVGAAAVINRHFQNDETTCRQLSIRLPDNSTIFAAEATAISLALNYYQHMDPVHHDVIV